jgi:hypothetical protein
MLEENFITSMIKSDGSLLAFFGRPVAAALGALTLAAWFLPPVIRRMRPCGVWGLTPATMTLPTVADGRREKVTDVGVTAATAATSVVDKDTTSGATMVAVGLGAVTTIWMAAPATGPRSVKAQATIVCDPDGAVVGYDHVNGPRRFRSCRPLTAAVPIAVPSP